MPRPGSPGAGKTMLARRLPSILPALTTDQEREVALVWAAQVAFDRAIGWGLKSEQSFCHTDMGLKSLPVRVPILEPQEGAR